MVETPTAASPISPKSTDADGESRVPESREPLWRHMLGESLRERRTDSGETLNEVAARGGIAAVSFRDRAGAEGTFERDYRCGWRRIRDHAA